MGQWFEEDLLISVDLDHGSYCNGAYEGPSNMRVSVEIGCDSKECRFQFFLAGYIAAGEDIITITGPLQLSPAGRSLACR